MTRALVLSGGGSVGIAWQTGLIAGLARGGVDVARADFIVGTSAGSAVGATLALGRDFEEQVDRYRRVAAESGPEPRSAAGPDRSMVERMARFMAVMERYADAEPEARRAAIGRFALEADALDEEAFVSMFRYLKDEPWPERYACTAVDARSGEFTVWDAAQEVELDRAVASSCAVPGIFSPITIKGRRYMDGGMRSGANADLAAGHERVLLVSLLSAERAQGGESRLARIFETQEEESKALADAGSELHVVTPDTGATEVMGMNLMDASIAPAAAVEGLRQGEQLASSVGRFWG